VSNSDESSDPARHNAELAGRDMKKNFGAAAEDYAKFRAGFPDSIFVRLASFGIGVKKQDVIDVGTGTGTLARGFAHRGCKVTGVDPDERLLDQARRIDEDSSVDIHYRVGVAEDLPVPDSSADVISAGQCWHWFDPAAAAHEFARAIREGGRVVVAHMDWLPLPGNIVEAMEKLVIKHNPRVAGLGDGDGFHPESLPYLHAAGFSRFEAFAYDLDVPYTHEGWRGRIRASAGVGASLSLDQIESFDIEHAELLRRLAPKVTSGSHTESLR
jgi:SAM-dependent methyltransferase